MGERSYDIGGASCAAMAILHDAAALRDEVVLQGAVRDLENHLESSAVSVAQVVGDLFSTQRLLEFSLSALNDAAAQKITDCILAQIPDRASTYLSSLSRQMLEQFSMTLLFLPYPSSLSEPRQLRECHQRMQRVTAVLQSLADHDFNTSSVVEDAAEIDERSDILFKVASPKQKKKKKGRQPQLKVVTDTQPFVEAKISVPTSPEEADAVAASLIDGLKLMLKSYIDCFRHPSLKAVFKRAYIPAEVIQPAEKDLSGPEVVPEKTNVEDLVPTAYPMVQPMKAALYFDSADGFGEWRILISTRANTDLRYMRKKSPALFDITLNKIKALSNGHFSFDNQKPLTDGAPVPIYEAKMTGDSRLVYQIDSVSEYESDVERQVIKIYGIFTHAQISRRFWDGVGHQLALKGKQYRERCKFRSRPTKVGEHTNVVLPATFPAPAETPKLSPSSALPDLHKDDLQKMHEMLILEKYVTLSQAFLNSIMADQDVALVFDVSPQEKRIIEHPASCYVLGRSGTGKTTTMLFKILSIERSWMAHQDTLIKPRQVFVTQSRVLADKVQEYYKRLDDSHSSADKDPAELQAMALARAAERDQGLVDRDEEIERRSDLPKSYSELRDEHFPMFMTFHQLCRLLEADYAHSMGKSTQSLLQIMAGVADAESSSKGDSQQHLTSFVSYDVFLNSYWKHFPQPLTKGLDPALVFGEIIGIIKGSELALTCEKGFLDKESYYSLSHRTQGMFANQRPTIYKLFVAYMKRKRDRQEYDAADRTHVLLKALEQYGLPGKQIDFLYIDEAQDNLLIDALVIRKICSNPDSGLFWAGDTAQTIAMGSAFRFDDLKSFLYRVENTGMSPGLSRTPPKAFQLAYNYRSHAGIVNCARSVVELITKFWPHAIDNLGEEQGIIDGLKPVFFSGWNDDTVRYEQFLFGDSGSQIEFGAQQCIMVRDEAAREKLQAQIGDIGLIMTPYESKGLEFNDVLLYNFFADSTVDLSQWRVVLNGMPQGSSEGQRAPRFDDSRHNGVCRELKILYVAITRARQNLWIADSSDKGNSMKLLWTARNQVQNCTPGSDIPRLAMSSTPEEWAKTARTLFDNKRYPQAMHCYERALLPRERAVAEAYCLRDQARGTAVEPGGDDTERVLAFRRAADAFWSSAEVAVKEKTSYYRIAAECYLQYGDELQAAHAYHNAAEYTHAARLYRRVGMFDEAVAVVKSHDVDPSVAENIIDVSRLEYARGGKLKQARELFDSDAKVIEFLDDCGLHVSQAELLEELGQYEQLAELHLAQGHTLEAIAAFVKDRNNPESAKRASKCVLDGVWQGLSLGIDPASEPVKANDTLQELLRRLDELDITHLEDEMRDEVLMFRAIVAKNSQQLCVLGERFHRWHKDDAAALLCLDHAFACPLELGHAPQATVTKILENFLLYSQLLLGFASQQYPSDLPAIRRLFAFTSEADSEDFFVVRKDTVLYAQCNERIRASSQPHEQGIAVIRTLLDFLLRRLLQDQLRIRIIEENELCRNAKAFRPCIVHAAFNRCTRVDCPLDHIPADKFDVEFFNLRVRIVLQQILIYTTAHAVMIPRSEQAHHQRFWLRLLHETLEPPFYKMGSLPTLRPALIPEFDAAIPVVRNWTIDWLYNAHPRGDMPSSYTVTSIIRIVSLGMAFDRDVLANHLWRATIVRSYRHFALMRGKEDAALYVIQDMCRFMMNNNVASLPSGMLFLNHVLVKRVPLDVGVLCNYMDHLCTLLVVANKLKNQNTLHGITLPRSWLQQVAHDLPVLFQRRMMSFYMYTVPMVDLLYQMYTGNDADHLTFERRDLSTLGWQIRSIFIARICKNLCLLAYNSPYRTLCQDVHRIVTSLQKHGDRFDRSYERYVTAYNWDAMSREVSNCVYGSALDEMIQLYDGNRPSMHQELPQNVRRIVYRKLDEVPALLVSGASIALQSTLRVEAVPFVPSFVQRPLAEPADEHGYDLEGRKDGQDHEDLSLVIEDESTSAAQPTEQEIKAANVIRRAFLRHRARLEQRDAPTEARKAIWLRIINLYCTAAESMEWTDRSYNMLFLGPLPHAYFCLERARHYVDETKRRAMRRLTSAVHLELEEVSGRMTEARQQRKEVTRLINALSPEAEVHKRCDVEELKARIGEVELFAESLPAAAKEEWSVDLELAVKGIVRERPPAPPPTPTQKFESKPALNMNTDDDLLYYGDVPYIDDSDELQRSPKMFPSQTA